MIGNLTDAATAARGIDAYLIGEGAYRRAYLINGVVYKVTYDGDGCGDNANLFEWNGYPDALNSAALIPNVRVPDTYLWPVGGMPVIAMQHIDGTIRGECFCSHPDEECEPYCLEYRLAHDLYRAGFTDCGYGNVIQDDYGTYWVVDFQ